MLGAGVLASMALTSAVAAPFCMRSQVMSPQCIYYDAGECEREAKRQNAYCDANPAELPVTSGTGQYCVVTSGRASLCAYFDRNTCSKDAERQHGVCASAVKIAPARTPDPYSAVNGQ
jgi:hypothetical protein